MSFEKQNVNPFKKGFTLWFEILKRANMRASDQMSRKDGQSHFESA